MEQMLICLSIALIAGLLMSRLAKAVNLPAVTSYLVAGLLRVELTGSHEVRMENHKGILAYGSEEIHVSGGKLIAKVRGRDLALRSMNASELLITGEIAGVDLT